MDHASVGMRQRAPEPRSECPNTDLQLTHASPFRQGPVSREWPRGIPNRGSGTWRQSLDLASFPESLYAEYAPPYRYREIFSKMARGFVHVSCTNFRPRGDFRTLPNKLARQLVSKYHFLRRGRGKCTSERVQILRPFLKRSVYTASRCGWKMEAGSLTKLRATACCARSTARVRLLVWATAHRGVCWSGAAVEADLRRRKAARGDASITAQRRPTCGAA